MVFSTKTSFIMVLVPNIECLPFQDRQFENFLAALWMYDWKVSCLAPPSVPNFQDRHELPGVPLLLGCHAKAQLNKNNLLEH
jgi:hypothetical protein